MSKFNLEANKVEYRIIIEPDYEYEIGDAEDEDEIRAILERDGALGFIVESRKVQGEWSTAWEMVDSCFGFLGNGTDYMLSQALESIPVGYGEVTVYELHPAHGGTRAMNTVSK